MTYKEKFLNRMGTSENSYKEKFIQRMNTNAANRNALSAKADEALASSVKLPSANNTLPLDEEIAASSVKLPKIDPKLAEITVNPRTNLYDPEASPSIDSFVSSLNETGSPYSPSVDDFPAIQSAYLNKRISENEEKKQAKANAGDKILEALGYTGGMFGAGALGTVQNTASLVSTSLGDLIRGGDYSEGYKKISDYLADKPLMSALLDSPTGNTQQAQNMVAYGAGVSPAVVSAYLQSKSNDNLVRSIEKSAPNLSDNYKEKVGGMAYTIGQQVPSLLLTGGGSASTALSKAVGSGLIGASSAGEKLTSLASQRGSDWKNYVNSLGTGLIEAGTEYILGTGGDAASFRQLVGGKAGRTLVKDLSYNALEEGVEEWIGYPVSTVLDWLTIGDTDAKELENLFDGKEWFESGVNGMIAAVIMGGASTVINIGANTMSDKITPQNAAASLNAFSEQYIDESVRPAPLDVETSSKKTIRQRSKEILNLIKNEANVIQGRTRREMASEVRGITRATQDTGGFYDELNSARDTKSQLDSFTEHEARNLLASAKNKVVGFGTTIREFVNDALSRKNGGERLYMGKLPQNVVELVKVSTGYDVSGFSPIINEHEIRHTISSHGDAAEQERLGQIAVTPEDFELIPEILSSPDSVSVSPKTDFGGRPALIFTKKIGDNYVTIQGYSKKKHGLMFDTMWKNKKASTTQKMPAQAPTSSITSETRVGTAPDSIISNFPENSNTQNEDRSLPNADTRDIITSEPTYEGGFANGREEEIRTGERGRRVPDIGISPSGDNRRGSESGLLNTGENISEPNTRRVGENRYRASSPAEGQKQIEYSPLSRENYTEAQRAAENVLSRAGIKTVMTDGPIVQINGDKITNQNEAVTFGGTVYMSSNATIPHVETAIHEATHIFDNTDEYDNLYASIWGLLDYHSPVYKSVIRKIGNAYYGNSFDESNTGHIEKCVDELIAYINGMNANDPDNARAQFADMFTDYDAFVSALDNFNSDMGLDANLPEGMGAASAGFDKMSALVNKYGAIPEGEGPYTEERAVQVPRMVSDSERVSDFVRTMLEAKATTNDVAERIGQKLLTEKFGAFESLPNTAVVEEARAELDRYGFSGTYAEWANDVKRGKRNAKISAMGQVLFAAASTNGRTQDALDIAADLISIARDAGQTTQSFRILKTLSPEAKFYSFVRSVKNLEREVNSLGKNRDIKLTIDPDLADAYINAKTEKEADEAYDALLQNIADQVPPTLYDMLNSWRYLCMLGNLRTHVRNIGSTAVFTIPRTASNVVSTVIQGGADLTSKAFGGKGIEKTRAILNPLSEKDRARITAAWDTFSQVEDAIQSGGKYDDSGSGFNAEINKRRRKFKRGWLGNGLEFLSYGNSKLLDIEDLATSKPAYAFSLASALKAGGVTAEQFLNAGKPGGITEAHADTIIDRAIKDAQKATFRDTNAFSEFISKSGNLIKSKNIVAKGAGVIVEGTMPFKKTPANIAVRIAEYSPAGLIKGLYDATVNIKRGKVTAAEAIDEISQGLTGSGIFALGMFLAARGLLKGGEAGDDKEENFEKTQGYQTYSLIIGDKAYSIDWLSPAATMLFAGANLYRMIHEKSGFSFSDCLSVLKDSFEPMLEMSMMSSLNDLFADAKYVDSGSEIMQVVAGRTTSYLSQFLPTILGQLERATENTRQSTYIDRNSEVDKNLQYLFGSWLNKVPGAEYNQIDYFDAWGRTQDTGKWYERALNNFINPSSVSDIKKEPIDEELKRLYDLGYTSVLPQKPAQSVKIDNRYMTADEYETYGITKGQTELEIKSNLANSDAYDALPDDIKAKAMELAAKYATETAKNTLDWYDNSNSDSWLKALDELDPDTAAVALAYKAAYDEVSGASQIENASEEDLDAFDELEKIYSKMTAKQQSDISDFADGLEEAMAVIQTGLPAEQYFEEKAKNSSFADKYLELTGTGLSSDKAKKVYDAVSVLTPSAGKSSVSDNQKYAAISNISSLSASEKLNAIKAYQPSDSNRYSQFATAYSYGISCSEFASYLIKLDEVRGGNAVNQDYANEAISYMNLDSKKKAILYALTNKKWKTGNKYGSVYGNRLVWTE